MAVCILGMALIMLNERLHGGEPPAAVQKQRISESTLTVKEGSDSSQVPRIQQTRPIEKERTIHEVNTYPREIRGEASMAVRNDNGQKKREDVTVKEERTIAEVRPLAKMEQETKKSEKERVVKVEKKERREKEIDRKDKDDKKKVEERKSDEKKELALETKQVALAENKSIRNFVVFVRERGATVRLNGTSEMQYKTSQMHAPERVLIEMDGEWDVPIPRIPKNDIVSKIRVSKQNKKTRVVLDLKEAPNSCRFLPKSSQQLDIRLDLKS